MPEIPLTPVSRSGPSFCLPPPLARGVASRAARTRRAADPRRGDRADRCRRDARSGRSRSRRSYAKLRQDHLSSALAKVERRRAEHRGSSASWWTSATCAAASPTSRGGCEGRRAGRQPGRAHRDPADRRELRRRQRHGHLRSGERAGVLLGNDLPGDRRHDGDRRAPHDLPGALPPHRLACARATASRLEHALRATSPTRSIGHAGRRPERRRGGRRQRRLLAGSCCPPARRCSAPPKAVVLRAARAHGAGRRRTRAAPCCRRAPASAPGAALEHPASARRGARPRPSPPGVLEPLSRASRPPRRLEGERPGSALARPPIQLTRAAAGARAARPRPRSRRARGAQKHSS